MENIEVELKFPLLNSEELIGKLSRLIGSGNGSELQKDTYYVPAHRNFLEKKPVSEWLRLRESKEGFSLNYKKYHNEEGDAVSCDEFESKVENLEAMKKLLESLDFEEIVCVSKERKIWNYKNVEIAIDAIEGLGEFIELEAKGDFASVDEAEEHLHSVLGELGAKVGEQDFKGYPFLLLEKRGLI